MPPKSADNAKAAGDAKPSAGPGPAAASTAGRPAGTDGSDFSYRQTIDDRYRRSAALKAKLAAVCRAHLTLAFVALAWAVAVPLMLGKTTVPLPCATAATALFCAGSGNSCAGGRVTGAQLEKYLKLTRSAIGLGMLALLLPRYTKVPGNPASDAAARHIAERFTLPFDLCKKVCAQADTMMEGALAFLPCIEWYYARRLRRIVGDGPLRKKTQ